jgi:pimeloyl-ACP methyl ester carboxylesterase
MSTAARSSHTLSGGGELSFVTAGDPRQTAILLLHGFPSSADTFRDIIGVLGEVSYVIAPDMPGFGASDVLATTSFNSYATAIGELLEHLDVGPRYIYLHDFGAPVGLRIAMDDPQLLCGLIIQNANAHESGQDGAWAATQAFWSHPNSENEAAATAHLTLDGIRDQYVAGVPPDVADNISPSVWQQDWRVMSQPGRLAAQRALIADYGNYTKKFDSIARYLQGSQPPALMVWGRHDSFFNIAEVVSWMQDLPRMEAHILDGGHFLLETHAAAAVTLMKDFIERTERDRTARNDG